MACSIARTLDVFGEPWTPLILRDVWVGITRFDQIWDDLGISTKVLTQRLAWLVETGVLIAELAPQTVTLEDLFFSLTEGDGELGTAPAPPAGELVGPE